MINTRFDIFLVYNDYESISCVKTSVTSLCQFSFEEKIEMIKSLENVSKNRVIEKEFNYFCRRFQPHERDGIQNKLKMCFKSRYTSNKTTA